MWALYLTGRLLVSGLTQDEALLLVANLQELAHGQIRIGWYPG